MVGPCSSCAGVSSPRTPREGSSGERQASGRGLDAILRRPPLTAGDAVLGHTGCPSRSASCCAVPSAPRITALVQCISGKTNNSAPPWGVGLDTRTAHWGRIVVHRGVHTPPRSKPPERLDARPHAAVSSTASRQRRMTRFGSQRSLHSLRSVGMTNAV